MEILGRIVRHCRLVRQHRTATKRLAAWRAGSGILTLSEATTVLLLATAQVAVFCGAAIAEGDAAGKPDAPLATWTLSTDDTKLVVGVGKDQQLYLYELSNPVAGWNWTATPSPFPLLARADVGGTQRAMQWKYQEAAVDSSDGVKVTIRFTNAEPALELKSVWHARPGRGPIRHTMSLTNNSGGPVTIYEQESLDLHVVGPKADTNVWYFSDDRGIPDPIGTYCDQLKDGYQKTLPVTSQDSDWVALVIVDSQGKCGVYAGWEWSNGRFVVAGDSTSTGASLTAGIGDVFRTELSAGETFEVPPGFVGAYAGDVDDAGNSLRRYLFRYNMPAMIRDELTFPKVEWNAFAATGKEPSSWDPVESKYYPLIDDIAPLGFEEVVIDVGWWSSYGDPGHIVADPADWPSGMAAAAKYAHDRGMRFGLYNNETEVLTTETGKKEFVDDITYLIKELHADFYRSDNTAGPAIQGGFGAGHRAYYPEDVLYWATKGFYEGLDSLYANMPTFLWENCQAGGSIKDYGASRRSAKIQDQDRYYPIDARQAFYDASHAFPPMQLATLVGMWSARCESTGSVYDFRSCSLGAAYWHPDAPNGGNGGPVWSEKQKAAIKQAVATYKEKIRPLIRNGDLYHIFPRPDGMHWDGVEYFDPAAKRGVVYLFKPAEGDGATTVKLRGVRPEARYRVVFEDGTNPTVEKTGAELIAGVNVQLFGVLASDWMFFDEIEQSIQ